MVRNPRWLLAVSLLASVWVGHTPIYADIPPERAVSADALQAALPKDIPAETLPGGYVVAVPEPFTKPIPATDPVYHFRCSRALYIYEKDVVRGVMTRRVTVHFEPDDLPSARRAARLIARLMRLHREHFNRETVFGRGGKVGDVWFVPTIPKTASEGGETRDANVYIFAASEIANPVELVRTVAHEWGHLTLPAARGYAEPESDAAGYLGERLYLRWLFFDERGDTKTPRPDDGTTPANLALYYNRQVAPLMRRWLEGGPNNPVLDQDRTEAMDYYIGAVLESDQAFSSRLVGSALYGISGESARDFLASFKETIDAELDRGVSFELATWVPLRPGTYTVPARSGSGNLVLKGPKTVRAAITGAPTTPPRFRITTPGWYKAYTESGSPMGVTLKAGAK